MGVTSHTDRGRDRVVGDVMRAMREWESGMSAREAGARLGLGMSTVGMYEAGTRTLHVERFLDLCELYGVEPSLALGFMALRCTAEVPS